MLNPHSAHVWEVEINAFRSSINDFAKCLTPAEQQAAARMLRDEDRDRALLSQTMLRLLLSRYVGASPASLIFERGPHGKPELKGHGVQFNISHAHGLILYIVCDTPVGIDLEWVKRPVNAMELAQRFFAESEYHQLMHLPEEAQTYAFYQLWVAKEAYVKFTGQGLSQSLQEFGVNLKHSDNLLEWVKNPAAAPCVLQSLPIREEYAAAVATAPQITNIQHSIALLDEFTS